MDRKEFKRKGKKFSLSWDSQERTLFLKMWGAHNKEDAEEFVTSFDKFLGKFPETKMINILVDALGITKVDHRARRVYTKSTKEHPQPANVAICCGNIILRVMAGFITTVSARKVNVKFFATVEDGVKWLKSKGGKKNK
jgi:hypothetical protein